MSFQAAQLRVSAGENISKKFRRGAGAVGAIDDCQRVPQITEPIGRRQD
jgi:hypothetical protein